MEHVEREELVGPGRKQMDELPPQHLVEPELHHLRQTQPCRAGAQQRCEAIDDETARNGNFDDFAPAVELPREWAARDRVAEEQAFVSSVREVHGPFRRPVALQIGRRGASQNPCLEQEAADEGGWLGLAEADGGVETFRDEIAEPVADHQFQRQQWVARQELAEPWSEDESREPWIDVDSERPARRRRGAGSLADGILEACE